MGSDTTGAAPELVSWLEQQPEPRILVDLDYRVRAANAAYRRAFATGDVVGRHCYEVSHGYAVPCHEAGESCPRQRALETGRIEEFVHTHRTPQGDDSVLVELTPLRDGSGRIGLFIERMQPLPTLRSDDGPAALVGSAPPFRRMLRELGRVAPTGTTVLLLGETGTGKELAARAIHAASPRAAEPFVVVECSGLSETLFESEMFGHERGAFTGAVARTTGLVEAARGGTLFLDEIGDVPLAQQVKLLRLIETGTFRRVGGVETLHADLRLVVATHRDLAAMVAAGQFRADLYYRVSAFPVVLPPLRDRLEDLRPLVESLLRRLAPRRRLRLAPQALAVLQRHDFPGNVRELRNVLERACLLADGDVIGVEHLPAWPGPASPRQPSARARPGSAGDDLLAALRSHRGSRRELAAALGISERTLYRRLRATGVTT